MADMRVYNNNIAICHIKGHILPICDMVKKNESDVGDVVFEILAKTVFKFHIVFSIVKSFYVTRYPIVMGLASK